MERSREEEEEEEEDGEVLSAKNVVGMEKDVEEEGTEETEVGAEKRDEGVNGMTSIRSDSAEVGAGSTGGGNRASSSLRMSSVVRPMRR